MDTVTIGERDRVVAILEDCIERLMLLSYARRSAKAAVCQ